MYLEQIVLCYRTIMENGMIKFFEARPLTNNKLGVKTLFYEQYTGILGFRIGSECLELCLKINLPNVNQIEEGAVECEKRREILI